MRPAVSFAVVLLSVAMAGCGTDDDIIEPPFQLDTIAVVFQDGASPSPTYSGTRDAILKDGPTPSLSNGNFGGVALDTIGTVQLGYAHYERRLIIRSDLTLITGCSKVLEATLTIRVEPIGPDSLTLQAYRVLRPSGNSWVEGIGGIAAGVSWATVDGGEAWSTAGGDVDPVPLDAETIVDDTAVTFSLPPALVLTWIRQPLENHGIIIAGAEPALPKSTTLFLRESSPAALRPRMRIVYIKGG